MQEEDQDKCYALVLETVHFNKRGRGLSGIDKVMRLRSNATYCLEAEEILHVYLLIKKICTCMNDRWREFLSIKRNRR